MDLNQQQPGNVDPNQVYQQQQPNPGYQQPNPGYQPSSAPVGQLKTDRGLLKCILLSIITCGIYGIVVYCEMSSSINTIASRYDNKNTMNYFLAMLLGAVTLFIYPIVWFHNFSDRIGNELRRRGINNDFSASTFWLWNVLGSFIIVGPLVYMHKLFKAMNELSAHYNTYG